MSTISRRIDTAINNITNRDYENALIQISIAIDSTAKKKWPKDGVGRRIRRFIKKNESFIYNIALSGGLILCTGGRIIIKDCELPQIIYKLIRCVLQHGDELSDKIVIKENFNTIGIEDDKVIINIGHIYGLLLAVIVDPMNINERCSSNPIIYFNGNQLFINNIWGDISKLKE